MTSEGWTPGRSVTACQVPVPSTASMTESEKLHKEIAGLRKDIQNLHITLRVLTETATNALRKFGL